jgi:hypothetical protein
MSLQGHGLPAKANPLAVAKGFPRRKKRRIAAIGESSQRDAQRRRWRHGDTEKDSRGKANPV